MVEYCPYCGLELQKTNWGRKFCKNCGIIDDEPEESSDETPSYV